MQLRQGIKINLSKNSGKAEEILILTPGGCGPFVNLYRQLIFSLLQEAIQRKFSRSKGITVVTDIGTVTIQGKGTFHPLKRNAYRLIFPGLRQHKVFYIGSHRIKMPGNFSRTNALMPLPGVLHIGVLRAIIALQLDMGRQHNILPVLAGIFQAFKIRNTILYSSCIMKLP